MEVGADTFGLAARGCIVALTSTCSSVSLYLSRSRDVESQPGRWSSNTTGGLVLTRYSGCDRIRSPGFGTFIAPDAVSDATPSLRACDLDYVERGRFGNERARPCAKTASSPVSGWRCSADRPLLIPNGRRVSVL
jgi:hypothetical protein